MRQAYISMLAALMALALAGAPCEAQGIRRGGPGRSAQRQGRMKQRIPRPSQGPKMDKSGESGPTQPRPGQPSAGQPGPNQPGVNRPGVNPPSQAGVNQSGSGNQGRHAGDWLRQYRDVPASQQEQALQADPGFRVLSPERQQQLRERLQQFRSLPPEQQQRMLSRMETWEHLTPEQKSQGRQMFQLLQQLPPERRQMVQRAVQSLRQMSPEQRQQALESDQFKNGFSQPERDILNGVTKLPLAPGAGAQDSSSPEQ